jgi:hypothetical protein
MWRKSKWGWILMLGTLSDTDVHMSIIITCRLFRCVLLWVCVFYKPGFKYHFKCLNYFHNCTEMYLWSLGSSHQPSPSSSLSLHHNGGTTFPLKLEQHCIFFRKTCETLPLQRVSAKWLRCKWIKYSNILYLKRQVEYFIVIWKYSRKVFENTLTHIHSHVFNPGIWK